MTRLITAAVGLALVVGIALGSVIGNPFGASAQPSVPNPGHSWSDIGLPTGTWPGLDADSVDGVHLCSDPVGPEGKVEVLFDNEPFGASETKTSPWVSVAGCREFEVFINTGVAIAGNQALWSPDGVTSIGGPTFSGNGLDSNPTNAFSFSGFAPYAGFQLKNNGSGHPISAWLLCAP